MRNNLLEAIIGAAVLVVAGFFLFFAYSSSHSNLPKGYILYAHFERIDGLNIGSDVKISGVKVGTIKTMEIDPTTYQAKVGIQVREDIKVPNDSSAEVASESLLGGKYVAVVPGGSDQYLSPDSVITQTQSSISFEALISKFLFSKNDQEKPKGSENTSHRE
jgi:phospholipid/cholesterol/gamma-HCH transport system substrate-binding protein